MVRIAISAEVFEAIAKTLPSGSVGYEEQGEREGRKAHLAGQGGGRPAALATRPRRVVQRCDFAAGGGGVRARKGTRRAGPRAMRYLKPSIHSVSACEPRPSAASIAALYPRNAWSLDMTPLVTGFSARSARRPATAPLKSPMSTQMSARCFAQVSCSSRLFMRPKVWNAMAWAVCHAGQAKTRFPPQRLQRSRRPAFPWDRHKVSGSASTLTLSLCACRFRMSP